MSGQREKRDRFVSNISVIYMCVCNIRNKKCCKPCDPFILPVLHPALCAIIVTFTWFILLPLSLYINLSALCSTIYSVRTFTMCSCLWKYTSVTQREDTDNPALLSTQANPTFSSFLFLSAPTLWLKHEGWREGLTSRFYTERVLQTTFTALCSRDRHSTGTQASMHNHTLDFYSPPTVTPTPQVLTWHFLIALNVNNASFTLLNVFSDFQEQNWRSTFSFVRKCIIKSEFQRWNYSFCRVIQNTWQM